MRNKAKLHKCICCSITDFDAACERTKSLPRSKKKQLHKAINVLKEIVPNGFYKWDFGTSCYQSGDYALLKPFINNLGYYQKYLKAILFMLDRAFFISEKLQLDIGNTWKFSWYWEYDNGLYTESGLMPLKFGKEDPEDKTWCWQATKNLCETFGLNILDIKNEQHLLREIDKKMKNGTINDALETVYNAE